jgi:hypothetical protein
MCRIDHIIKMTSEGTHDVQKCRENLKPKEEEPLAPSVTSEQDKTLESEVSSCNVCFQRKE